MKRFLSALAALAAVLLCAAPAAAAADTSEYAAEVVSLVNAERAKAGLSALAVDSALGAAARQRAREVSESFGHTRPGGAQWHTVLAEYGVAYGRAGENIAQGQKTPADVVGAWMASPGHRDNILGEYTHIGVGAHEKNGTVSWAQLFAGTESGGGADGNFFMRIWNWIVANTWGRLMGFLGRPARR